MTDTNTPKTYYLNEYITNKSYGGPDEGGWFYSTGRFIECHGTSTTREAANRHLFTLQIDLSKRQAGKHKPSSVGCTGYPDIFIQAHPGADYPATRPLYR